MNREECLQCGTALIDADCTVCERAGRIEALAMAGVLTLIALGLGLFVWIQLI